MSSGDALLGRLQALLLDRPSLSFGVARRQLVIEGVATDPDNPVLGGLAGRLHRHRVGAVTLLRGIGADELSGLLGALAREADPAPPPRGEAPRLPSWPHARLHPLSYAQLELSGGEDDAPDADREGAARAAQLWVGLARAALSTGDDDVPPPSEPAVVARAIDEHPRAAAYDQVIVGHLLQIAQELKGDGGPGAAEVRRRTSRMISELSPETLRRLVEMGGDAAQRHRFVLDASYGFATEAVIRVVEAAAGASEQTLSHALVRLLSKLALHAGQQASPVRTAADAALRDQVRLLVAGWGLPDPNPGLYTRALDGLARREAGPVGVLPGPNGPEPERIVQTALEVDAHGPAVWSAVERMAGGDGAPALVRALAAAPAGTRLADQAWRWLAAPHHLRHLLRAAPAEADALAALAGRMDPDTAAASLLDELAGSESRVVRRAALAALARMGPVAARAAVARLDDPRWYVQRNLLALLAEAGVPAGFSPAPFARHGDPRVRREAFRVWLALPDAGERPRALAAALVEADEQTLRTALAAAQSGCPPEVVPLLCGRLADDSLPSELRVQAVRALGAAAHPLALGALLRLVEGKRGWFGRRRLAPRSPEMLAALGALASAWRAHPDAVPLLELAVKSTDIEVLGAVLAPGGEE